MSDYNFLMETRLPPELFQVISQISRAAGEQGLNLYLVGGAVRDLTYGQQLIHDLDFTVEGNPEKIIRHLMTAGHRHAAAAPGASAPVAVEHAEYSRRLNTAEVTFSNGVRAEISMSRSEFYATPGRPPQIVPATIFEDLRRRDFSVNAMAVSLHPNSRGLLLDPTNGAADIEKRELRALHSRSLSEDPSRIYRLLRLSMRLGFKPDERTQTQLDSALANKLWTRLNPEQQGRELRTILQEDDPGRILKALGDKGLLAGLDKKLSPRKIPYEQFKKTRAVSRLVPNADPFLLNFHTLVAKLGGGQRARLAKKIIGDGKTVKTALGLEKAAKKLARLLASSRGALPSRAYKILVDQPLTTLLFLLAHFPLAKVQSRVKGFLEKVPQLRASFPRAELLSLGAKSGPKLERVLEHLFFAQLDGKIKVHAQLVKHFRTMAGIPEPKPAKPAPEKPRVAKPAKLMRESKVPKPAMPTAKPAGKGSKPSPQKKPTAKKRARPKSRHR
jgi:tRNA nucleotidyltransferase (CCA-adding enzyme)